MWGIVDGKAGSLADARHIELLSTIVYMEVQWDAHLESQEQGW